MTFYEGLLTLQLLSEERAGFTIRRTAEILRAQEDAAFTQVAGLSRGNR